MHLRSLFLLGAVVALAFLAVAACSSGSPGVPTPNSEDATFAGGGGLETLTVPARWSATSAADLPTLIRSSDAVFQGKVVREGEQRTEPLSQHLSANTQIPISSFEVRVERVISGDIAPGEAVSIEQVGGVLSRQDGSRHALVLEQDQLLVVGEQYLLFAVRGDNGTLTSPPFGRWRVAGGRLKSLPAWEGTGASKALDGRSLADGLEAVARAVGR
ncbi:MAG TPA: hypothetical protein VLS25_10240 [Dehalococcoidia bacterium]|nr:hypothetical protein [Dehalococcoidia bacterium]